MYEILKKIGKRILPKRVLERNEAVLRKIIAFKYRGQKRLCNICDFKLSHFIELENKEQLCPSCGSLPRTRRLWQILEGMDLQNKKLLHFSPPKSLVKRIGESQIKNYVTTDYEGEFKATKQLNIEAIDEADASYDLIICYHVLEHIPNDQQAMKELERILKPEGFCLIQTPFKTGAIYENEAIQSPEERLLHFGQEDHVRVYSVEALKGRLETAGFRVEVKIFTSEAHNKFGFKEKETVLLAQKKA